MPVLILVGIARDGPFGGRGAISAALGKVFGLLPVRTRATGSQAAWVDTHDLGHLISCEEILVEGCYDLELVPFQPDIVVDCGAHIGLFSLIAGLRYPEAALNAFEPHPANVFILNRQLARFGGRVHLTEAAVSTTTGMDWFYSEDSNTGRISDESAPCAVQVRRVDLAKSIQYDIGTRLLLKMDIEGEELRVLPHVISLLPRQCALYFETHGGEEAWQEISTLLVEHSFQVSLTRNRGQFKDGFALR